MNGPQGSAESISSALEGTRLFLRANVARELQGQFGVPDAWVDHVTAQWFDDNVNYDGRWHFLDKLGATMGRILDMSAGCGTFMLYGLRHGHDVYGVEPEEWKRRYFASKLGAVGHPQEWTDRLVDAVGEQLPWPRASFNVVSCYQTLEHVQSVAGCLAEMFRVLKPGGLLHIRAPDYRSFFEPHYRLPFLPRMNRRLAALYLHALGRPTAGLATLNWISEPEIRALIRAYSPTSTVTSIEETFEVNRLAKLQSLLPRALHISWLLRILSRVIRLRTDLHLLLRIGREEKQMDLLVRLAEPKGANGPSRG